MAEPKLALIPSGVADNQVFSILPSNGDGDFDFSRGSAATRVNAQGLIETVSNDLPRLNYPLLDGKVVGCPSLLLENSATNLVTYSEAFGNSYWTKSGASIEGDPSTAGAEQVVNGDFATDSDWTKAGLATIGLGAANFVDGGANTYSYIRQNISQEVGKSYQVTFEIKNYVSGGLQLVLQGQGAFGNYSANGTYTVTLNSSTLNGYIEFSRNFSGGTFSFSIDNVSVKEVSGFASPSVDSPLGAFKLVEGTNNGSHRINLKTTITLGSVAEHTYSIFAKKGENNFIAIFDLGSSKGRWFDLNNGTIEAARANPPIYSKIEEFSNGWYKCSITVESPSSNGNMYLYTSSNGVDANVSYQGDGTSGVYIFGAQLEQGSYPTSYIPTQGGIETRLTETCNGAGTSDTFNDSEGVLYVEASKLDVSAGEGTIAITKDVSNEIRLNFATNNRLNVFVNVGGVNQVYMDNLNYNLEDYNKIAIKYKLNDYAIYVNGTEIHTDTNATVPLNLNSVDFNQGTSSANFYGNCKDLRVFNTALTDAQLTTLTSYSSFNEMALALNYTIQ